MDVGEAVVLDIEGLDALIGELGGLGYETKGPVVRDGAVVPGPVSGVGDLPAGWHDTQAPGRYRLEHRSDPTVFGWAVGPGSWKAEFFPPTQEIWHTEPGDGGVRIAGPDPGGGAVRPLAVVGARPCELAGLAVLDRVLMGGAVADPHYAGRRRDAFVVVAECGAPAATCFCPSMGSGPHATGGYDIALTEIDDGGGHRFVARAGTERGFLVLAAVSPRAAGPDDHGARRAVLERSEAAIGRRLDTDGLADLLARNPEHPRWEEVARRCLACGNCTLVCPTCFCSDVVDTTDLSATVTRTRTWASCFDLDHSYLHGGPVRTSVSSRYRQWLTHKLSTWWDQFGTSGCVGCGRCIAWCPVGIDLTEETAAIAADDGATRSRVAGLGARPREAPQ